MGKKIKELTDKLGIETDNYEIFMQAVTHTSYAHEHKNKKIQHNERLEFLGDAVLELIISEMLYFKYPDLPEGELTKLRAAMVCEDSLLEIANNLDLGEYLRLGRGEEVSGGRERSSILADALEALIGVLYLEKGYKETKKIVTTWMGKKLGNVKSTKYAMDYKTTLQELTQRKYYACPSYKIVEEAGPDHNKEFLVEVEINGKLWARGSGKSKKEAEQEAAKAAWEKLEKGRNL